MTTCKESKVYPLPAEVVAQKTVAPQCRADCTDSRCVCKQCYWDRWVCVGWLLQQKADKSCAVVKSVKDSCTYASECASGKCISRVFTFIHNKLRD